MNNLLKCHAAALLLVGLTACSSTPPPKAELQRAEQALDVATESQAAAHAAEPYAEAQRKIEQAEVLMKKKKHAAARRLLQQAEVDAQLATAAAAASRSQQQRDQIEASIEALKTKPEAQAASDEY